MKTEDRVLKKEKEMSAGLFALSINPESFQGDFQEIIFWGTSYAQHFSGKFSGFASFDGKRIISDSKSGLFAPNFEERISEFIGPEAIGYCGPAEEPFYVGKSDVGSFSACFGGNIRNCDELIRDFLHAKHNFERTDDIVAMSKLIIQGADIIDGIRRMSEKIDGAYTLLLLTPEGIYAVRSPDGHWPLVIGCSKEQDAVIVASECVGFDNLGFKRVRDIEPGEIVLLKDGHWFKKSALPKTQVQECSFFGAYTSSRAAIVHGIPATLIRRGLGAASAKRDIADDFTPHVVMGVPASGLSSAEGYKETFDAEINRQISSGNITLKWVPFYRQDLIKHIMVRSYLAPTQEERERRAYYKIVITSETIKHILQWLEEEGLTVILGDIKSKRRIILVVCDDSIVRGSQMKSNLAPKTRIIYEMEVDGVDIKVEIHLRISFPPLRSYCPHGKTTKRGETLVEQHPDEEDRIRALGVDGLKYNSVDDLVGIIGKPREQLCIDCCFRRE